METVTITLTKYDEEQFRMFQKHYEIFRVLVDRGALNITTGKCTLNFHQGTLQNVVKEEMVFHRSIPVQSS